MSSVEAIGMRQTVLQKHRKDLDKAIAQSKEISQHKKASGKVLGLKIPDEMRERMDAQQEAWGIGTHKKTALTLMLVGLEQLEFLHRCKDPSTPKLKVRDSEGFGDENERRSMARVQKVFGSDDPGDSARQTAERRSLNEPRGPGVSSNREGGNWG